MLFDSNIINRMLGLNDDDSDEFKALYRELDYEKILEKLNDGSAPWLSNTNQEVMSFLRTGHTEVDKTWFYFISCKLVPD